MKYDKVLISIHPEFVDKILTGVKKFEYRKKFPIDVKQMVIYSTSPVKKITAVVDVDYVLYDVPSIIWDKTGIYSGITKEYFDAYFKDKNLAYAIKIKNVQVLSCPLILTDLYGIKSAPQSWVYLRNIN